MIKNPEKIQNRFSRLLQEPPIIDCNNSIILYRGTSLSNFKKIKTQGIKPRGKKISNWKKGIGTSRPDDIRKWRRYFLWRKKYR